MYQVRRQVRRKLICFKLNTEESTFPDMIHEMRVGEHAIPPESGNSFPL